MIEFVFDHDAGSLSELDRLAISHIPPGGNWRDLPPDFPSARIRQIRAGAAAGDGSRSTYYGRLSWEVTAATIATYFVRPGNGANIHPSAARTLTFREAARLQGFADSVRFHGSRRARAVQIGNAVPPPVAAAVARSLPVKGLAVELFAGAGGLSAGVHAAGFGLLAAADHDPDALATLSHHVHLIDERPPDCVDLSDAATRSAFADEILARANGERLALLAGGPPCQGFSTAGANDVANDERNDLLGSFVWFVERLRPRQVLMENVAALTFRTRRPWFNAACAAIERLGYRVSWAIVHCEAFGLPQRRRRLVLVATERGIPPMEFPAGACAIQEPAYRAVAQPEARAPHEPPVVREAIGDLPETPSATGGEPVRLVDDGVETQYRRYLRGVISLSDYADTASRSDKAPRHDRRHRQPSLPSIA